MAETADRETAAAGGSPGHLPGCACCGDGCGPYLEPADISTLDRDGDILVPTGLLVLPEPVVVVNRAGSLSDTKAFGWQFATQYQILPTAQYPGVRVTTFMDRDGPVQPLGWRQAVSQARASGSPLPPLMPDGMYGMRGDACLAEESSEMLADLSERHRQMQKALSQACQWRSEPVPEIGEWCGDRVENPYDDFVGRYMFAFWRLIAQGVTAVAPSPAVSGVHGEVNGGDGPAESGQRAGSRRIFRTPSARPANSSYAVGSSERANRCETTVSGLIRPARARAIRGGSS